MTAPVLDPPQTRAERLKRETHALHERLDAGIAAREPFADRERYAAFVEVQYRFYAAIEPLYHDPRLGRLIAGLPARSRLDAAPGRPRGPRPRRYRRRRRIPYPTARAWLALRVGGIHPRCRIPAQGRRGDRPRRGARRAASRRRTGGPRPPLAELQGGAERRSLSPEEDAEVVAGALAAFDHVRGLVPR